MSDDVKVFSGLLGWGRKRTGLEFYATGGRWVNRLRPPTTAEDNAIGDVLVDHMETAGVFEGQAVIVIVLPGRAEGLPCETVQDRMREAWTGFVLDPDAWGKMIHLLADCLAIRADGLSQQTYDQILQVQLVADELLRAEKRKLQEMCGKCSNPRELRSRVLQEKEAKGGKPDGSVGEGQSSD